MLVLYFAFLVIVSSVSAAPSRQKRFDVFDPFPSSFAFARPFGAGAYAGVGFPFFQPYPWYFPMPDYSMFTPWYKGPNVCETKKVFEEPDIMKEWLDEGFSDSTSYKEESESCRGNNEKYVCMRRAQGGDSSKMEVRKYECCYGFVRPMDGRPGCVENPKGASSVPTTPSPVKMNEQMRYNYFKSSGSSSSSSSGKRSGVESVPAQ